MPATRLVYVADREADMIELIKYAQDCGTPADWLVRPKGGSIHSGRRMTGRRMMASRLLAQDHDLDTIQLMLGYAELECVDPYVEVSDETLRQAFADVI